MTARRALVVHPQQAGIDPPFEAPRTALPQDRPPSAPARPAGRSCAHGLPLRFTRRRALPLYDSGGRVRLAPRLRCLTDMSRRRNFLGEQPMRGRTLLLAGAAVAVLGLVTAAAPAQYPYQQPQLPQVSIGHGRIVVTTPQAPYYQPQYPGYPTQYPGYQTQYPSS